MGRKKGPLWASLWAWLGRGSFLRSPLSPVPGSLCPTEAPEVTSVPALSSSRRLFAVSSKAWGFRSWVPALLPPPVTRSH